MNAKTDLYVDTESLSSLGQGLRDLLYKRRESLTEAERSILSNAASCLGIVAEKCSVNPLVTLANCDMSLHSAALVTSKQAASVEHKRKLRIKGKE